MLQVVADGYSHIRRLKAELAGAEELMASEQGDELRALAREEQAILKQQVAICRSCRLGVGRGVGGLWVPTSRTE